MINKLVVKNILKVLDISDGRALPEKLILDYVNLELDSVVTQSEFDEQLRFVQERGWIDFRVNEFKETRWYLTDAGQVQVSKSR